MKIRLALPLFILLLLAPGAALCGGEGKIKVVATAFPVHQIARNVARGSTGVDLTLLVSATLGCPHDYSLTPAEMSRLAGADALIINGLGLEDYLDKALARAQRGLKVIDASSGIGEPLYAVEEGKRYVNPHIFASPRMSGRMALSIGEGLARIDPANAALYRANASAYKTSADALAVEFAALGARLANRRVITQHAVFDYLAADMGLEIVAVVEEHGGREPGAAVMRGLVRKARESGAGAVFTEPQYPPGVGRTIAREVGIPVASLDPVAGGPADAPEDYFFTVMRRNMTALEATLGVR